MTKKQEITISALNVEDEEIQFQIELTNGICSTAIDFYGYANEFNIFADELCSFPKTIKSEVKYELGEQGDIWAYFILLRVYCYEKTGHTAIQIKIDNNRKEPFKNYNEFSILTVPASINILGQLLKNWNPKIENEIKWTAE